ncbi:type II toxin-antitoxin system VapC family toxin [Kineosporiaceae bacterium SCSIO 59966]|nr:type II toxin-antitoxin system VapC family toxin [Kineosporiaceae bacterium SCSIO 59966]
MIVLDTNVVSELMRPVPAPAVVAWAMSLDASEQHMTAITAAEICYGIERLPDGRRKSLLRDAAREVLAGFSDKVLSFDLDAAHEYADVVSRRERQGNPINALDAQIAAICRSHGAALATRNVKDFAGIAIELVDPWSSH